MRDKEEFHQILQAIDGSDFTEYQRLIGDFDFTRFILRFTQVGRFPDDVMLFVVRVPQGMASFPEELFATPVRRTALEDFLTRRMAVCIEGLQRFDASGIARRRLTSARPGQKILPRSAVVVEEDYVEARIYVKLSQRDGRIDAESTVDIFFEDLPRVVAGSFIYHNLDTAVVNHYVQLMEDVDSVRQILPTRGWIGFMGEGSALMRDLPSDTPRVHGSPPLKVNPAMVSEVEVTPEVTWRGLAIPAGLTVILGDEISGRRELMRALAAGIYNHVPGDGRERVVMVPDAVYVSAEAGRSVHGVNLAPFLRADGPWRYPVDDYSSVSAEAYTAQAASTVEALEVGARVLLFDESDSVPSFLSIDSRLGDGSSMRGLKPLCVQARQMVDELGISIVVGGCTAVAEFIPLADTVLTIENFEVKDITAEAREFPIKPLEMEKSLADVHELVDQARWIVPSSVEPSWGRDDAHILAPEPDVLVFGDDLVDLGGVRQLAEAEQTETIGRILRFSKDRYLTEPRPIREVLDLVDRDLSTEGLDCLGRELNGMLARPRRYELAAALNRLPSLRVFREQT